MLAAGLYNGQVLFWDLRSDKPAAITPGESEKPKTTEAEKSHYDAVLDVVWPNSKTGSECISCSPDGKVLWWDMKNYQQGPICTATVTDGSTPDGGRTLGATRIGDSLEQPMKVLIGTEQGYVAQIMRKPGNKGDVQSRFGFDGGKHHGPIFGIQRNPSLSLNKYFLTVGDWTAKVWAEDVKVPLTTTRYHDAYLTDGCWSLTRPGIFFLTRSDGWIDIWDYFYRQNEVCYSQKISDYSLTCMASRPRTSDILIGDASGSITLLQLCKSLWEPLPKGHEEGILKTMFEREANRERTLQQRKAQEGKKEKDKDKTKDPKAVERRKSFINERMINLERDFFSAAKQYEEDLSSGKFSPEYIAAEKSAPEQKSPAKAETAKGKGKEVKGKEVKEVKKEAKDEGKQEAKTEEKKEAKTEAKSEGKEEGKAETKEENKEGAEVKKDDEEYKFEEGDKDEGELGADILAAEGEEEPKPGEEKKEPPAEAKPEDKKPEEKQPDEKKPEEKKPEDKKPEEKKPEENTEPPKEEHKS
jgi:dynein intermediate chain 2